MADLPVSTVRQRVETAVDAVAGTTVSRYHVDLFGRDARQMQQKAFAVGTRSSVVQPDGQRRRVSELVRVDTELIVKVAHRVRGDSQVADADAATDFEQTIIQTVVAVARTDGLTISLQSAEREATDGGEFHISTITFRALHQLALQ